MGKKLLNMAYKPEKLQSDIDLKVLTNDEYGVFHRLLECEWIGGCLNCDDSVLKSLAQESDYKWPKMRASVVDRFFVVLPSLEDVVQKIRGDLERRGVEPKEVFEQYISAYGSPDGKLIYPPSLNRRLYGLAFRILRQQNKLQTFEEFEG